MLRYLGYGIWFKIVLIRYSICFLKASVIFNVTVVPNDVFKFGGEINKLIHVYIKSSAVRNRLPAPLESRTKLFVRVFSAP